MNLRHNLIKKELKRLGYSQQSHLKEETMGIIFPFPKKYFCNPQKLQELVKYLFQERNT